MLGAHFKTSANNTTQIDYSKIYKDSKIESEIKSAILRNDIDLVLKLVKSGVPLNSKHLKYAIWLDKSDMVEKLLESNVTFTSEHLNFALENEREVLCVKLLESGIKPTEDTLNYTIQNSSDDLILKIAKSGINPTADNLENAIFFGREELIFNILLSRELFTPDHIYTILTFGNSSQALKILEAKPSLLNQIQLDTIVLSIPEFVNEIIKNCSKEKIVDLVINLFAKGHFTEAKNYFEKYSLDRIIIDPVDLVSTSIEIDIKGAIEQNKYGAIANLIYRAGIYIPEKHQKYIANISDDIPENNFEFIRALIHKLAEHYILLAKNDLLKQVSNDEKTIKLVDQIFNKTSTAQEKYNVLEELRELHPESKYLEKAKSPFDAIYLIAGKALENIGNNFALEVLALNGIVPSKIEKQFSGCRGFHYIISDEALEDMFLYGHRAPSAAENQKILGYHVSNAWTKAVSSGGNLWEFGGTYLSLEPSYCVLYSLGLVRGNKNNNGRNIYLESSPIQSYPIVFGNNKYQKEIVLAGVKGDEIVAIYELDDDAKIIKIFQNPYIEALPRYNLGDKISYDKKAAENYNILYKATETYENYEHFLKSYVYEAKRLDQFYENRPELPNQVCISPKTLSEIRLDMDVFSYICVEE